MGYKWAVILWIPLLAAAESNRYIVELSGDPVAEHVAKASKTAGRRLAMNSAVAQTRRIQLRDEQRQARTSLADLGVQVLDSTEMISNSLIVRMPAELVPQVEALPGVKRVRQARKFSAELDHAIPLHKVPDAWNLIGVDKAGLGIKIGVIDSGIDIGHPGMQDSSLQTPAGFPKTNADSDVAFTNSKVIVARSYANLFDQPEDDLSARDVDGHGTSTAMAAGGVRNNGPIGPIVGVAPKAWLGAYKVFGANGGGTTDVILKAVDDAVADGMDVITASISSAIAAPRLADDIEADAFERIAISGIVMVNSVGNKSDPNTIGSPATAPDVIAVGASHNDRIFVDGTVVVDSGTPIAAYLGEFSGDDPYPFTPVTGPLVDVSTIDQDGTACLPLPPRSLAGKIALIVRLPCTFEEKLANLQAAGALAAVLYTVPEREFTRDSPPGFNVGAATLPMMMIHNADGLAIKNQISAKPGVTATLDFELTSLPASPDGVAEFSSRGPNVDGAIKPDMVAVGSDFYTATSNPDGPPAYTIASGTSFSTPLVAGAAALLKGARPGLTAAQYRSLLINTATTITAGIQESGAGVLNMIGAMQSTFTLAPTSLSFLTGGASPNISKTLTISNLGTQQETYSLTVAPRGSGAAPTLGTNSVTLDPGKSADVQVRFSASGLTTGQYEGFVKVNGTVSGVEERAPYWYAVPSDAPARVTLLDTQLFDPSTQDFWKAGVRINDAIEFRVTEASGIVLPNVQPTVTAESGGGAIVSTASMNRTFPGVFSVTVRLGTRKGNNVFRIAVGNLAPVDITIVGN